MSSLKDLKDLGAFVATELVRREIKFKLHDDGDELSAVIHVRRLNLGLQESIWTGGDKKATPSATAKFISEVVRLGESGEEKMTYEEAFELHPALAVAMTNAINEVNGGERKN